MIQDARLGPVFRFGPFEFRAGAWELRKSGVVRKLSPQPARVLLLLISSPGQIITREQLQQAVWGDDVTVDYELGLNRCIRQIRSALLDDIDSPRYIKTIPRLGYTFIAPVDKEELAPLPVEEGMAELFAVEPFTAQELELEVLDEISSVPQPSLSPAKFPSFSFARGRLWRRLQMVAILVASGLVAIGIWEYVVRPAPVLAINGYQQLTNEPYSIIVKSSDFDRSIAADGSRIYFSVLTGAATSAIAQVAEVGGETSLLATPFTSPVLLDVSRHRSELLLAGGGAGSIGDSPVWTQPVPSGSVRRIANITAHGASWSPAGDRLVYAAGSDLLLTDAAGRSSTVIARFDAQRGQLPYWPRWSPDGLRIRFSVFDGNQNASSLWEIGLEGANLQPLLSKTQDLRDSCCGTWTPDGKNYVFTSLEGTRSDLWALPVETSFLDQLRRTSTPIRLTAGPLSYSSPTPGSANAMFVIGNSSRGELERYDSQSQEFVPMASAISAVQADFSRDGKWIAYISSDGSLWQAKSDGTGRTQLSFPPLSAAAPRWSPDGLSIAYFGRNPGELNSVYVTSAGAATARNITMGTGHDEKDPDWSLDGKRMVFADTSVPERQASIQIVDLQNGHIAPVPSSEPVRSPRWSPDGRYLSALSTDLKRLFIYDLAAKTWTPVAAFRMGYPNWSRDGRYIYVVNLSAAPAVSRIRISDHGVEQVIDMSHRTQYWTADAWLGLTPNDAPLLSRDLSIQQIFALQLGSKTATR